MLITSLLYRFGIRHVVVCPGSRNAPLVDAFARCADTYTVHPVTDERSAGFVAIGLSEITDKPVAVCVTSGTAVANVYPAVVEAYHRNIPLVVISADRPKEWIDQMDGQTMAQPGAYGKYAEYCDILPEIYDEERHWYNNREINRVLTYALSFSKPIHINIQLKEPLFNFEPTEKLIDKTERIVKTEAVGCAAKEKCTYTLSAEAQEEWKRAERRMIIIGQHGVSDQLSNAMLRLNKEHKAVVLAETLSNLPLESITGENYNIAPRDNSEAPDMILYIGGHIINKELKLWLRKQETKHIWRIGSWGHKEMPDLLKNLTRQILADDEEKAIDAICNIESGTSSTAFYTSWGKSAVGATVKIQQAIVDTVLSHKALEEANLVLANSSTIRYAQKSVGFDAKKCHYVTCNRGVNGIEGTISQAVGVALGDKERLTVCITGDLSFFYDHNALWNTHTPDNLRIILINDGGGEIFKGLKGLEVSPVRDALIMAGHRTSAEGWCKDCGVDYRQVLEGEYRDGTEWLFCGKNECRVLEIRLWV